MTITARRCAAPVLPILLLLASTSPAVAQESTQTVYNNFGPGHDGWDWRYDGGWTVAGDDSDNPFGVEQAFSFVPTSSGLVTDIWVGFFKSPLDPLADEVTIRLAHNDDDEPPTLDDVMEEWTISEFETWDAWSPPHHLIGSGLSHFEEGHSYWLWAIGDETPNTGWGFNGGDTYDPALTLSHTLRREGEDWLPIGLETASAIRVDVTRDATPCEGDANGDGVVDPLDSGYVLARFGCSVGTGNPDCDVADQNADGVVDPLDTGYVLARFGECP